MVSLEGIIIPMILDVLCDFLSKIDGRISTKMGGYYGKVH
jgi:hypothetical protein